jgi:hypothetical protein
VYVWKHDGISAYFYADDLGLYAQVPAGSG